MQKYAVIAMAMVALALTACSPDSPTGFEQLTAQQAQAVLGGSDPIKILDIRTPAEYANGRIEGAVNIDFYGRDFKARLDQLDKDATYLVYCRSGNRSSNSLSIFQELGFKRILHLRSGIKQWIGQGLPLVR